MEKTGHFICPHSMQFPFISLLGGHLSVSFSCVYFGFFSGRPDHKALANVKTFKRSWKRFSFLILGLLMELLPFSTCLWGDGCGLVSKGRNWPGNSFYPSRTLFFSSSEHGGSVWCGFTSLYARLFFREKKKKPSRLGTSLVVQGSSSLGDSALPRQRVWVQFLIKQLDPTRHN